ncbi:MAG: type IV secretion system protein B10 [Pelagerythrobacter marensis]|nr:MAG: type IV secretion system protein B10 [Pelagerythrobacter marensis]
MSLAERARLYPASPVQVRPVVVAGPVVSPRSAPAVAPPASSSFPAADARNYTVPPPPVWETPRLAGPAEITAAQPAGDPEAQATRVRAARLANPAFTVPQGTVIPAVLETGFDGSQVLIHRGSRLIGEYDAGLQQGERRALVRWTRLVRPDGVTIALDSPASDPLGRAGIEGEVDSRFLQRFGNALLQSILDVGTGLAVRRATDGVIVALPGSTQNVQRSPDNQIRPTLRVRHGTSVSVFVARDLDFSGF